MTVKERILALKLLEKQEDNPEIMTKMGVQIKLEEPDAKEGEKSL